MSGSGSKSGSGVTETRGSLSGIWIKRHLRQLQDLPEPGETWRGRNRSEWVANRLDKLHQVGIIRSVGMEVDGKSRRNIWETTPGAYEKLQSFLSEDDRGRSLPCGHAVRFESVGGGIECKTCGDFHTTADVAYLRGGGNAE